MKIPFRHGHYLVVTNGGGRLFVQTLLPQDAQVRLMSGADLYAYGGWDYPPSRDTGPAPECRIEVSPPEPQVFDSFLHVLTATDADVESVPRAAVEVGADDVTVSVGGTQMRFSLQEVGGSIRTADGWAPLSPTVLMPDDFPAVAPSLASPTAAK